MRQGPNGRRPRGRHHSGGHNGGTGGGHDRGNAGGSPSLGNNNRPRSAASLRHQTFDSNCIDVRVRGNAWQVHEKYQALARDAQSSGDRVAAENYFQHAEHYYRIIEAINEATAAEQHSRPQQPQQPYGQQPEMPSNYYGPDGTPSGGAPSASGNGEPNGNVSSQSSQSEHAEAQVEVRNPPQPAFFAPEEMDESQDSTNEPRVARR